MKLGFLPNSSRTGVPVQEQQRVRDAITQNKQAPCKEDCSACAIPETLALNDAQLFFASHMHRRLVLPWQRQCFNHLPHHSIRQATCRRTGGSNSKSEILPVATRLLLSSCSIQHGPTIVASTLLTLSLVS